MASLSELARILEQIKERLGPNRTLEGELAKLNNVNPTNLALPKNKNSIGDTVKVVMGDIPGVTQLVNEFQKLNRLFSTLFPGGGTKFLDLFKGIGTIPKALNALTGTPVSAVGNAVVNLATNKSSDVIRGGVQAVTEATILSKVLNRGATASGDKFNPLNIVKEGLHDILTNKDTSLKNIIPNYKPKGDFDADVIYEHLIDSIKELGKVSVSTSNILSNFWTGFRHPIDSVKNIMSGPIGKNIFTTMSNVGSEWNKSNLDDRMVRNLFNQPNAKLGRPESWLGKIAGNIKGSIGGVMERIGGAGLNEAPIMAEALTSTKGAMGETIMKWTGGTATTVAASKVAGVVGAKVAGAGAGAAGVGAGGTGAGAAGAGAIGAGVAGVGAIATGVGIALGAILLVGAALVGLAATTIGVSKMMIESQRHLADVNAQMAVGFAMHDLRTFFRDMASAQRRAPSTVGLMESYDSVMLKIQPAIDKFFEIFAKGLIQILDIIGSVAEVLEKLYNNPIVKAAINVAGAAAVGGGIGLKAGASVGFSNPVYNLVTGGLGLKLWSYLTKADEVADKQGRVADKALVTEHLSPEIMINQLAFGNYEGVKDRAFERLKPSWLGP